MAMRVLGSENGKAKGASRSQDKKGTKALTIIYRFQVISLGEIHKDAFFGFYAKAESDC